MKEKTKVSILGASGLTGKELVKILSRHSMVEVNRLFSRSNPGKDICDIYPDLKGIVSAELAEPSTENILEDKSHVFFLALPPTKSTEYVPALFGKKKLIIDLSADYRFKDSRNYEKWYGIARKDSDIMDKAVYGLPEINRENIKSASLISNPGCYATAAIISIYPMLKEGVIDDRIYVDAKSGISGAGKKVESSYLFLNRYENITPYKVNSHRHMGEITEFLSRSINRKWDGLVFCPHMVPMERGILLNMYASVKKEFREKDIRDIYVDYYGNQHFINIYSTGEFPQTAQVRNTNNCNIGIHFDSESGELVVITAIDNLIKGASGQAVQNMNIALGLPETTGLI